MELELKSQYKIYNILKKECSVYLTVNLCPKLGLYNSAEGTVKSIWNISTKIKMKNATEWKNAFYDNELPIVWVDFPNFKGKHF